MSGGGRARISIILHRNDLAEYVVLDMNHTYSKYAMLAVHEVFAMNQESKSTHVTVYVSKPPRVDRYPWVVHGSHCRNAGELRCTKRYLPFPLVL